MGELHSSRTTNDPASNAQANSFSPLYGSVLPLPQRSAPRPWEDLSSLLCRIAAKMGYPDLRWILHPQGSAHGIKASSLPLLSRQADYQLLQRQLLLDETSLYSLTAHLFAPVLDNRREQRSGSPLLLTPSLFTAYFLEYPHTHVCPSCLEENGAYDRCYWRMNLVLFCPLHRTPLRDRCPHCSRVISALRLDPVRCPFCQSGDYREPVSAPLVREHLFLVSTNLFLHALGIAFPQETPFLQQICPMLTQLTAKDQVAFLHHVMTNLVKAYSLEELLIFLVAIEALSEEDMHTQQEVLSTATHAAFFLFHALFLDWPAHLFRFFDLFYALGVPPFLGQKQTPVVGDCQRIFSVPWLQPIYQHYLQSYRSDEKTVYRTHLFLQRVAKQLDQHESGLAYQQQAVLSQRQSQDLSHPARIEPFPWESLPSLIARVARQLGGYHPRQLLHPRGCFYHFPENSLLILTSSRDYAFLEYLLQVDVATLYHLTLHRFADLLQHYDTYLISDDFPSLALNTRLWLFPDTIHIKVCPHCLAEKPYDRLYWMAQIVLVCPFHQVRLVHQCPSCLEKIPVLRPSVFHCPHCTRGDYRTAPVSGLPADHLLIVAAGLFLHALGVPLPPEYLPTHLTPSPLLTVGATSYVRLIEQLAFEFFSELPQKTLLSICRSLGMTFSDDFAQQGKGKQNSLQLEIPLFHWLFTAWPAHFSAGLEALYRTIPVPPYQCFTYGMEQCQQALTKLFADPDFSWLREAHKVHMQQFFHSVWYQAEKKKEWEALPPWESLF